MTLTRRHLVVLAGLGSALLLGGAYVFQALGYAPCKMCLWQRWPHGAAIVISAVALVVPLAALALVGALSALTTAGIGVYHTGVERGWWEGPSSCSSGDIGGMSTDDLFNQIMQAPLVRCDEVAWQLLGLSMASWNALISLCLAALWIAASLRRSG